MGLKKVNMTERKIRKYKLIERTSLIFSTRGKGKGKISWEENWPCAQVGKKNRILRGGGVCDFHTKKLYICEKKYLKKINLFFIML